MRGFPAGGPKDSTFDYVEWSRPSRGRTTILYRRSLHRGVALDPDTLEWWCADLQPWRAGPMVSGLEVALRRRLPPGSLPDDDTHALAVEVVQGRVSLDDAARDLCLAFRALDLPDENALAWLRPPRPNFM